MPPTRHRLGGLLPRQLADRPQTILKATCVFTLAGTMGNYPVFRRAMPHFKVCIYVLLSRSPVALQLALQDPLDLHARIHAASVHPEPGSNSQKEN